MISMTCATLALVVTWRMLLGEHLQRERIRVKRWKPTQAAKAAQIDIRTLHRIEEGTENYGVKPLERYALALGKPLEEWLRLVLRETGRGA